MVNVRRGSCQSLPSRFTSQRKDHLAEVAIVDVFKAHESNSVWATQCRMRPNSASRF